LSGPWWVVWGGRPIMFKAVWSRGVPIGMLLVIVGAQPTIPQEEELLWESHSL
jgi:hypothetical protein